MAIITFAAITARHAILFGGLDCVADDDEGGVDGDVADDPPSVVDMTAQLKLTRSA